MLAARSTATGIAGGMPMSAEMTMTETATAGVSRSTWAEVADVIELAGQLQLIELASQNGIHTKGTPYEWEHGYIPLTPVAAASHGHGKVPKDWHAPGGRSKDAAKAEPVKAPPDRFTGPDGTMAMGNWHAGHQAIAQAPLDVLPKDRSRQVPVPGSKYGRNVKGAWSDPVWVAKPGGGYAMSARWKSKEQKVSGDDGKYVTHPAMDERVLTPFTGDASGKKAQEDKAEAAAQVKQQAADAVKQQAATRAQAEQDARQQVADAARQVKAAAAARDRQVKANAQAKAASDARNARMDAQEADRKAKSAQEAAERAQTDREHAEMVARERKAGESNAKAERRIMALHTAQRAHMTEATGISFPHPTDLSPNSRDAGQAADHFRTGDLPAAADALDRAAASDGNKARAAKIAKLAAKVRAAKVKAVLPPLVRTGGGPGGMTAIDHNGTEHKISLKDGLVTVTTAAGSLTAPAGSDPTTVARKLAGQLAGGTVQTANTWDELTAVIDLAATATAPAQPRKAGIMTSVTAAGNAAAPTAGVSRQRAAVTPPKARPRLVPLTPMRQQTAKSLRKLAASVQGTHPEMAVHDHLRDAARVLESGNEEGAQRHLRAAIGSLTPQALMRHGIHTDDGHIQAKQAMAGAHRHILLVKDIQDAGAKNRAAIERRAGEDEAASPLPPVPPQRVDPNAGYGPGALAQKPTARQPGGDRAMNAPNRTNSGGSDPNVADPDGPQPRGSKQFARTWGELLGVIDLAGQPDVKVAKAPGFMPDFIPSQVADLSAETGRLAVTPAPYGKPGGPGLYGVKGNKHSDYEEQVVQALMRRGMDKGKATAIARSSIRKWMAKSKHPEVRAAAGMAEGQEIAAQARAHAHAVTWDDLGAVIDLAGPSAQPRVGSGSAAGGQFAAVGTAGTAAAKPAAKGEPAPVMPAPAKLAAPGKPAAKGKPPAAQQKPKRPDLAQAKQNMLNQAAGKRQQAAVLQKQITDTQAIIAAAQAGVGKTASTDNSTSAQAGSTTSTAGSTTASTATTAPISSTSSTASKTSTAGKTAAAAALSASTTAAITQMQTQVTTWQGQVATLLAQATSLTTLANKMGT